MIELNWKQTDPLSQEWDDMIDEILGADEIGQIALTSWEAEFVDSVSMQRSKGRDLSAKQTSVLRRIHGKIE